MSAFWPSFHIRAKGRSFTIGYKDSSSRIECGIRGVKAVLPNATVMTSFADLRQITSAFGTVIESAARHGVESDDIALGKMINWLSSAAIVVYDPRLSNLAGVDRRCLQAEQCVHSLHDPTPVGLVGFAMRDVDDAHQCELLLKPTCLFLVGGERMVTPTYYSQAASVAGNVVRYNDSGAPPEANILHKTWFDEGTGTGTSSHTGDMLPLCLRHAYIVVGLSAVMMVCAVVVS